MSPETQNFHTGPAPNWFELSLGVGGMLSHWWLKFVGHFDEFVAGVAFYGGALLVALQLWKIARAYYLQWRGN